MKQLPGLEGQSFCKASWAVCSAQWFWWESWIWSEYIFPWVCWQPPPRWEVRPEPGTNWSFSYDQWLLSPWQRWRWAQEAVAGALRELSFSPICDGRDGGFYLGVHHSQGLRPCLVLHFCAGFTFSLVHVTWLEAGSGSEGLLPHYSAGFALISYGGLHPGANSTLPKCGQGGACWQWLPVSIRGRGRDQAGFIPLCACSWAMVASTLVRVSSKTLSSHSVCSFWAWSSPRSHPTFSQQSSSPTALGYSSLV